MKEDIESKRNKEFRTVLLMIQIFCKGQHKNRFAMTSYENLCDDCKKSCNYVRVRIQKCPFMETKTFCSVCHIHCYQKYERAKIRTVMRYAGPRMLKYHPVLAIKHVLQTIKIKRGLKNENN